jgi:DNA-binding CsgD family transcriptional regulator
MNKKDSLLSFGRAALGSAFFWVSGYLTFLSPVLFPIHREIQASIGIEYGFFVSQITLVLFTTALVIISKLRLIFIGRKTILFGAIFMSLSIILLHASLLQSYFWLTVFCGVIHAICYVLLGTAWGTRYSLNLKQIALLILLSFLCAYGVYFIVSALPGYLAIPILAVLPLLSWLLWNADARMRHDVSNEVFSVKSTSGDFQALGEILSGSWEAKAFPWKVLLPLMLAAFIGNFMSSVIMKGTYHGAETVVPGGVLVCVFLIIVSLITLFLYKSVFRINIMYKIALIVTSLGLVGFLTLGLEDTYYAGAITQGCAFYLQILIILIVSRSTQEAGISPLLSFSIGFGIISAVAFVSYSLGEAAGILLKMVEGVLQITAGICLFVLVVMLVIMLNIKRYFFESEFTESEVVKPKEIPQEQFTVAIRVFSAQYGLTKREAEVLRYLVKGRSLPYIADLLFVTTGTIKTHTTRIYRKIDISSKQELMDVFEDSL